MQNMEKNVNKIYRSNVNSNTREGGRSGSDIGKAKEYTQGYNCRRSLIDMAPDVSKNHEKLENLRMNINVTRGSKALRG